VHNNSSRFTDPYGTLEFEEYLEITKVASVLASIAGTAYICKYHPEIKPSTPSPYLIDEFDLPIYFAAETCHLFWKISESLRLVNEGIGQP
jgi:hypothetical protein